MEEQIKRLLSSRPAKRIAETRRIRSAVLMPLYVLGGEYHILFIQRTQTVSTHKGQISFPGGRSEAGDGTLLNTALRETEEEIGIAQSDVRLLGELDDTATSNSDYLISPFVGLIPWPYRINPQQSEVAGIIDASINELLEPSRCSSGRDHIDGVETRTYFYDYQGKVIWGATARILHLFLDLWREAERQP
jgi:8-oxo-dGTP pyrophosphatase MutT (NUDIX family)